MSNEVKKHPDDLVKVINISAKPYKNEQGKDVEPKHEAIEFQYDSQVFSVDKDPIVIKRSTAEHGRRRAYVVAHEGRRHRLEIVELPVEQRDPQKFYVAHNTKIEKELDAVKAENEKLLAQVAKLKGK